MLPAACLLLLNCSASFPDRREGGRSVAIGVSVVLAVRPADSPTSPQHGLFPHLSPTCKVFANKLFVKSKNLPLQTANQRHLAACKYIERSSVIPGRSAAMFLDVPSSVTGCKHSLTDLRTPENMAADLPGMTLHPLHVPDPIT